MLGFMKRLKGGLQFVSLDADAPDIQKQTRDRAFVGRRLRSVDGKLVQLFLEVAQPARARRARLPLSARLGAGVQLAPFSLELRRARAERPEVAGPLGEIPRGLGVNPE